MKAAALVAVSLLALGCPAEKPPPVDPAPRRPREVEPAVPATVDHVGLEAKLEAHVRTWAFADAGNPWALAHGIAALGTQHRLADGRSPVDAILREASVRELGGRRFPAFVGSAPDGTPLEPHHNMLVRALLEAGVPLDHPFEAGERKWTVRDLYEGVLWSFERPDRWGPEAWTLMAIAHVSQNTAGGTPTFVNHRGEKFDARLLAVDSTRQLREEMAFFEEARRVGRLVKRRQGVYAETCGGYHFVQASIRWAGDPEVGAALAPHLAQIADLLDYRLDAETRVYEEARAQVGTRYRLLIDIQELKFYGHWLETMGDLRAAGHPTDPKSVARAKLRLAAAVTRLEAQRAFTSMEIYRESRHQSYLDLIGDSAHALKGLRAWR